MKNVEVVDIVFDDLEDYVVRKIFIVFYFLGFFGDNCRNVMDFFFGDLKEDFSVTLVSRNGEVKFVSFI